MVYGIVKLGVSYSIMSSLKWSLIIYDLFLGTPIFCRKIEKKIKVMVGTLKLNFINNSSQKKIN